MLIDKAGGQHRETLIRSVALSRLRSIEAEVVVFELSENAKNEMASLERKLEALPEPFKSRIQEALQEIRIDLTNLDEGEDAEPGGPGWTRKPENDPETLFGDETK